MIKKGELVKGFKCYSEDLYIFRMDKFDNKGAYMKIGKEDHCFGWQFVTKLSDEELKVLGLKN